MNSDEIKAAVKEVLQAAENGDAKMPQAGIDLITQFLIDIHSIADSQREIANNS